jgi:hypothetical protein
MSLFVPQARVASSRERRPMLTVFAIAAVAVAGGESRADGLSPIAGAFGETKPIIDLRLRTETVEQEPLADDAHATTLRLRAGFETGKAWNTALLIEGEGIMPIGKSYRPDPMIPEMTTYPVVADPEAYEINRFQLANTSLPGTTITLGRQRIALDDQRFVGPVAWRQNEQTFDALRVVNRSVANLVIDATYFNKVNRLFGEKSPQGDYEGDSGLLNVGYQTKVGKITAFGYLLDFENIVGVPAAVRDSTATYGLRFAGEKPVGKIKLAYAASYATQSDYADNPLTFDLDYKMAELTATFRQYSLGVGKEIMEGDLVAPGVTKGFTTPLATLHKFQGWADKFLTTPGNGLEDLYATAGVTLKGVGALDTVAAVVSFHDYETERTSADFGKEWNFSLSTKFKRAALLLKYAEYEEGAVALGSPRNTDKVWAQLEFLW